MSVLNKMLRDLEQREQRAVAAQPAGGSIGRDDSRPLWLNLLLLLSAGLLLFAVYAILNRPDIAPVQPVAAAAIHAKQPLQQSEAEAVHSEQPPALQTDAMPTDITLTESVAVPTPAITDVTAEPSLAPEQAITAADSATVSALVALAAPLAHDMTEGSAAPIAKPAGQLPVVAKIEVQRSAQTAAEKSAVLQQQAAQAAQAGQLMQAISLWQQVQALLPAQTTAYTAQARLWQQMQQPARAQQVLQQGLGNGAESADIRLLLAQYYAQQQQWSAAEAVLEPQYEMQLQPEYYGLKATTAQQLGNSVAAQLWFSQLIVLQPQQPRWWLGAAIAFDQQGQRQQAQLHYRQALQWGDTLSVASRNYIQQRLAATE